MAPPPVVAPTRADPNKAFVPPPGWMPPGTATRVAAVAPPAVAAPAGTLPTGAPAQVAVIQFGPMSSELNGKDQSVLARVAQSPAGQPRQGAHRRPFAQQDGSGSSADQGARQFEMSRQRTLAVANQLVRLGVPANRIVAEAASDEEPAYETNTARGIAANRRAEIFVEF